MKRWTLLACLAAAPACDDVIFEPHGGGGEPAGGEGFCAVQALVSSQCLSCHSAGAALGGLDLETDLHGTLVDQPSISYPSWTLVVPGDPDASLLVAKLEGTQGDAGDVMPPTGPPDEATVAAVRQWVADGADDVCATVGTGSGTGDRQHTPLWSAPDNHGLAVQLQTYPDCRTCHGAALDGELGPSCDTCHDGGGTAWRTDCTFCHGGGENTTGAPPEDIDGTADPEAISFPAHTAHVEGQWHEPYACSECHAEPTDVLTPGHLLDDDTPAVAEVDLSGGLSSMASYDGAGTCSDSYCHGTGTGNGAVSVGDAVDCDSCHRTTSAVDELSGEHRDHLEAGMTCADCHGDVVAPELSIVGPALHVNGQPDLRLPGTLQQSGNTCTGSCHGQLHEADDWR